MGNKPHIVGIVNITSDSFSDGGKFIDAGAAIAHALTLAGDGAEIIDLGPAASNPDAETVSSEEEIRRIDPVISELQTRNIKISVDSFQPGTQRYAISRGVQYLNDIQGFPDPDFYPYLADSNCKLVVMHSMQERGRAIRDDIEPDAAWSHLLEFFDRRITALERAGVARSRLILDPGMGFFLSRNPAASFLVLSRLPDLARQFDIPLFVSVSRKSFLRAAAGREVTDIGPATIAGELLAAIQGAAYIRTHVVGALRDALCVLEAFNTHANR